MSVAKHFVKHIFRRIFSTKNFKIVKSKSISSLVPFERVGDINYYFTEHYLTYSDVFFWLEKN